VHQPAAGPTPERLKQAGKLKDGDFEIGGNKRDGHRYKMTDSPLARALVRQKISGEEFTGLKKYALHWFAGGLAGHLNSIDLNRVLAFDPCAMSGLAKNEAQADHRNLYRAAREQIGYVRPEIAFVADCVACFEIDLMVVGHHLGFRSPYRARVAALELLRDAGDRLAEFWEKLRNQEF
jgi:hypothetical protein